MGYLTDNELRVLPDPTACLFAKPTISPDPSEELSRKAEIDEQNMEQGKPGCSAPSVDLPTVKTVGNKWKRAVQAVQALERLKSKSDSRKRLFRSSSMGVSLRCTNCSAEGVGVDGVLLTDEEDYSVKTFWEYFGDSFRYVPEPILGLALGVASFGSALNSGNDQLVDDGYFYSRDAQPGVALFFSCVGLFVMMIYCVKAARFWQEVVSNLEHPDWSAAYGLAGMALMTIGPTFQPYTEAAAAVIWWSGLVGFVLTTINFTYQQRYRKVDPFTFATMRDQVFPLLMVPIVGIEVGTFTSVSIEPKPEWIPRACFWSGVVGSLTIHVLLMFRLFGGSPLPDGVFPTTFIMMAPKFLLLVAWLSLHPTNPYPDFTHFLFFFGLFSWVVNHVALVKRCYNSPTRWLPYTPAYASFTFPLSIAAKGTFRYYELTGHEYVKWIGVVFLVETAVAVVGVMGVFLINGCALCYPIAEAKLPNLGTFLPSISMRKDSMRGEGG